MIDQAGIKIAHGYPMAAERIRGVNDNMQKAHYHDYMELYYLEEGERYLCYNGQVKKMQAGDLALFFPYSMHFSYGEPDVPFQRIVVYFTEDLILDPSLLEQLRDNPLGYHLQSKEKLLIRRMLEEILEEQEREDDFSRSCMQGFLNGLICKLLRYQPGGLSSLRGEKQDIRDILTYINLHYNEPLYLNTLANQFFLSPYHLSREFKAFTGQTLPQYINRTRIMHAQRKFQETDHNVSGVCKEVGYNNLIHFNREFKQLTGMTPSQYRKHLAK